ncbi:hypothetical protein [Streptomyces caeruleatus]|uniref:TPM domain-containing protein n=1 Tax=Streptomyces caeruleatus TaxID=661399 RepID=A0A101TJQ0_9ACTN|nr:hypothetical protein [Streptomyces caeruleatus]KUN93606.1 hypothetical protein AQJ67_38375 [Streptomyces caeruleatus]
MAIGIRGPRTRHPWRTRVTRALLALCALAALFATATAPARAATDTAPQAAYLADRLRENPVHVTDQLPREVPQSTARDFAEVAERTGVPTYVLVLPSLSGTDPGLLDAVHERLGRDGLYVLLDESRVTDAVAYGVDAPADDASTVALYELPYDVGPLRRFERFAEVVAQGDEKAKARAEAAREKYDDGAEPANAYIGSTDRSEQSSFTGALLVVVPLLILVLVPYVRRWWLRLSPAPQDKGIEGTKGAKGAKGAKETKKGESGKQAKRPVVPPASRTLRWTVAGLALASAVAVVVAAPRVYDQTRSSWSPPPRAFELNARLDRVAEGLAEDPVYADPESPRVLDAAQLDRLQSRIRAFARSDGGGPVFVSLVPQLMEDESGGDEEAFAAAVHDKLGKDGVYVVADPLHGSIDVFNYGLRLDSYSLAFDMPESITVGDANALDADDYLMGSRLAALMTVLDKTERSDEPTTADSPYPVTDAVREDELPPLFGPDFWSALFPGVVVAGAVFGVVAGLLGIVGRALRRRKPEPAV